jgi:hypothetical protein
MLSYKWTIFAMEELTKVSQIICWLLQIRVDKVYEVVSNGVSRTGSWEITDSCLLRLDRDRRLDRSFNILKVTSDSLVIYTKRGNIAYTQHYSKVADNSSFQEDPSGLLNTMSKSFPARRSYDKNGDVVDSVSTKK